MDEKKRIEELVDLLNEYGYHYYTLDNPIVTDGEYDKLYDELVRLEKKTGYILMQSPTRRVGGKVLEGFEKHTHLRELYSLQKAQSKDEVKEWMNRCERLIAQYSQTTQMSFSPLQYIIELKFDGLTINLTYQNQMLQLATTRGNGTTGEIITNQILTIPSIPLSIDYDGLLEVQGEGLMPLSALKHFNETHKEQLKNARNAAAGALRNLDPKVTKSRNLTAYFYNVNYMEHEEMASQKEMFNFLQRNHFKVHPYRKVCKTYEEIVSCIDEIEALRHTLDILTDGVVIKIDDYSIRDALGYTNKFPRWAIAFKFEPDEYSTILKDVVWNVGRTGKITPTAILEPVEIGNVTVRRATLNNYEDIQRKKIRLGSHVMIRRSNDVIPEILGVMGKDTTETKEIILPKYCPYCNTELIRNGVHTFCPNSLACKPQLVSRLVHFASRNAMDIEGLSEKTVEKMVEILGVKEIADIYDVTRASLFKIPGFKEKKTANLLRAIEKSKNVALQNFLFAIGIPEVGEKTAYILANKYKTLDNLKKATVAELVEIEDIGLIMATEIVEFFQAEHIVSSLDRLLSKGIVIESPSEEKSHSLEGMTVVLTGSLIHYTRSELKKLLQEKSAKVTSTVSKNTDYVIVGDKPGSKFQKAKELGIPIIEEKDLDEFLNS